MFKYTSPAVSKGVIELLHDDSLSGILEDLEMLGNLTDFREMSGVKILSQKTINLLLTTFVRRFCNQSCPSIRLFQLCLLNKLTCDVDFVHCRRS